MVVFSCMSANCPYPPRNYADSPRGVRARRCLALLALAVILFFAPAHLSGQILFSHLDHTNGLPQINVVSIYQDETGAMWFGTISGLCRYNGSSTRVFYSSPEYPGLTKNSILQITGNRAGAIYIRTEFDLIRYDLATDTFRVISNDVTGICYANGRLWFTSGSSLYTWSEESQAIAFHSEMTVVGGRRIAIAVAPGGEVWYGGSGGMSVGRHRVLEGPFVYSLFIDSSGIVWAGTRDDGLYAFDPNGTLTWHFRHLNDTGGTHSGISDNFVRTIAQDEDGMILVGTSMGLDSFNKSTGEWTNYAPDETQPGSLSDHSVFAIYRDAQNTMWVGTYYGGVNYFNSRHDIFRYYRAAPSQPDRLSYPFVGPMVQDNEGNLWIGTDGGGLNCFDPAARRFTRYFYEPYVPENMPNYHIKSIVYDPSSSKLYMGVYGVGLWVFDTRSRRGEMYRNRELMAMNMQRVGGEIIANTGWKMFRVDTATDTMVPFTDDEELNLLMGSEYVYQFFIDRGGRMWLSSYTGLNRVDLSAKRKREYRHDGSDPRSFGASTVMSFIETAAGELFFGTLGSGLFRYNPTTDDFDNFTVANGAQVSDFCYHISEMPDGNLLILHNDSFSIFSPAQGITIYRSSANFPLSGFFEGNRSLVTPGGEIFIGGVNGLASVAVADITGSHPIDYNLYFDHLVVNGATIRPQDPTRILPRSLPLTDRLKLRHNQNNLSVEFATSDYSRHRPASEYKYRMEGLDETWQIASAYTITYTSLPPGRYTLAVCEANPDRNDKAQKFARLEIVVTPPLYKSAFAQVVYALLSVALVVGIILFFEWRYRMRARLETERREKENIEQLNRTKLAFFTSVSHEFRTPLTLIMAQTKLILSSDSLSEVQRSGITKVYNNATHMRELISELLDFRKAEQGFQTLNPEPMDLVPYIGGIWQSFSEYAAGHKIKYEYDHSQTGVLEAHIDKVQFKKAIYNLLSNAFKYTSDGGAITVRLRADECIHIEVEDNGIGIPAEALSRIFERFYQAEYRTSGFSLGTGIGLALTKEIIESHGGNISVKSTIDRGSLFEITLPTGPGDHDTKPTAAPQAWTLEEAAGPIEAPETAGAVENELAGIEPASILAPPASLHYRNGDSATTILIVEDNEELLSLLAGIFAVDYTVLTAVNGREGLAAATEHLPDIILTDVMMPEMSGKEMCREIKSDVRLAHIPVVMLTSLDSTDQTIEGYMFGADDYVAKPFEMEILKARCAAILRIRQTLYRTVTESRETTAVEIRSEQDRLFMEKVTGIIRMNFDNPDFDMNMLASEMCMGRTNFYTRVKEISGMTPNEFTLATRLRESAELLKNHLHLNITEIAEKLGFFSTKYFSKCFKTFYGVSPAQWRKENE